MKPQYGRCGCGAVEYTANAEPLNVINCHCNLCRSFNGSSFSTYVVFRADAFEIAKGETELSEFRESNGIKKFCRHCGTPVYSQPDKFLGLRMVFLGTLANRADLVPRRNVWSESQLPWIGDIKEIESVARD